MGNNLSNKTNQEIEEYILNISSYEAEIDVEVETNKNKTKYKIKQSYVTKYRKTNNFRTKQHKWSRNSI